MSIVYEVSPECGKRKCRVESWDDPRMPHVRLYQHGDNPEAVLKIPTVMLVGYDPPWEAACTMFLEFVERCHAYEDDEVGL